MWSLDFVRKRPFPTLLPALLLLIFFAAQLATFAHTSPTYDEYEYISRGYTHLRTGNTTLLLRHPVLLDTLAAVPLLLLNPTIPQDAPSLAQGDFHVYSRLFFWELNANLADQMIWLARLVPLTLTLVLATAVFRWAATQFGLTAGLVALTLAVFDPNLRAHGRLVTPDAGQTAFFFLTCFLWWHYLRKPTTPRLLAAAIFLGLAQTAGFPGLILYPVLAVATAVSWHSWSSRANMGTAVRVLVAAGLVSLGVIWAVYRFQWGPVSFWRWPLPAPYHWEEFYSLLQRLGREDLSYLMGDVYRGGRWSFFPIALLVKTPLPILLLAALGLGQFIWRRNLRATIALWLFPVVYFVFALVGSLNIGYRHILPILPFLYVWGGAAVAQIASVRLRRVTAVATVGWLVVVSTAVHPYYLAYFNELAGGPVNGRSFLVVSDLDWGQDLIGLQRYVQQNDLDNIYLSYFGTTPPAHYGLDYRPLPAWPPRGLPDQTYYHPDYPLPGVYAISAANLLGARFEQNPATFAWFWNQQPLARIGYSIDIYEVPRLLNPVAPAADVLLADAELAQLPAAFIEQELQTNDLRPRWVDWQQGLMLPDGPFWLFAPADTAPAPALAERFLAAPLAEFDEPGQQLLRLDGAALRLERLAQMGTAVQSNAGLAQNTPVDWATAVTLLGYEWVDATPEPGGALELLTYWQVQGPVNAPLTTFAHLLDAGGQLVAQFDGVGARPSSWYAGDWLVQRHLIPLPTDLPPDLSGVAIGWYDAATLQRLPLAAGGDRVIIPLAVDPS